jgi:secreted Zn-dependent insulinase-like peptidase
MTNVKHAAILNALHLNGPQDYLALERLLGMSGLHRLVNYLQQQGLIVGLPKKARELRQYRLTNEGMARIGKITVQKQFIYEPLVFKEFMPVRPGAMDAMQIKSRGIGA